MWVQNNNNNNKCIVVNKTCNVFGLMRVEYNHILSLAPLARLTTRWRAYSCA